LLGTIASVVLGNFTVTFLVIGLVVSGVAIARMPVPRSTAAIYESLLRWFLFFSVGCSMLYNFVAHVFFHEAVARIIGWADSPFQIEVGLASLGFAVVGFIAFRGDWQVRLASIAGPACFLAGAGVGHLYQIATTHDMAPGNAGAILYTDFLVPGIGFALLWLAYRSRDDRATRAP
jgi:hypothetical protein